MFVTPECVVNGEYEDDVGMLHQDETVWGNQKDFET
jgi:hypothetical protein